MNISIKEHIMNNFKGASKDDIRESIVSSFNDKDEITLPGLGVFFGIIWNPLIHCNKGWFRKVFSAKGYLVC